MLADFGLSKEGVIDNYGAKSFCGSMAYLAPEMLKRVGHGRAVDWYHLGVLLYEMLVGKPPYSSASKEDMLSSIEQGQIIFPESMSIEAKHLIISLLEKNPMIRLGSSSRDGDEIKEH
jgi:protein-serine/threonine kinase